MPNLVNSLQFTVYSFKKSVYRLPSTVYRKSSGFTLIELLIVISIIGILATFVIASFTGAQARGRDARRKADLDAIKKAVELAKADSTGSAYYPACDTPITIDAIASSCAITGTNTNPDLTTTYIKAVPPDPSGGAASYVYTPAPGGCLVNACTGFSLRACLENLSDPQSDPQKGLTDTCTSLTLVSYTVSNP